MSSPTSFLPFCGLCPFISPLPCSSCSSKSHLSGSWKSHCSAYPMKGPEPTLPSLILSLTSCTHFWCKSVRNDQKPLPNYETQRIFPWSLNSFFQQLTSEQGRWSRFLPIHSLSQVQKQVHFEGLHSYISFCLLNFRCIVNDWGKLWLKCNIMKLFWKSVWCLSEVPISLSILCLYC